MSTVKTAPYDRHGNLCHHHTDGVWYDQDETPAPGKGRTPHGPEWRPIKEFTTAIRYDGYARGRSAAYFLWRDTNSNARYPMFLADIDDMIRSGMLTGTLVAGRFTVVKRGQNYGIRYVGRPGE